MQHRQTVAARASSGRVLGRVRVGRQGLSADTTAVAGGTVVTLRGESVVAYR
jgi:hypothetical protein